jgi:hypothetical protein
MAWQKQRHQHMADVQRQRVKGEIFLSLVAPLGVERNALSFPSGLPVIMVGAGAGLSGASVMSGSIHAVGVDAHFAECVQNEIVTGRKKIDNQGELQLAHSYDLSWIPARAFRIFLVFNCTLLSELPSTQEVTFKITAESGRVLLDQTYDVREARDSTALVLAVLERAEDGWLLGPVGSIQQRFSLLWMEKILPTLSEYWGAGLPNPLARVRPAGSLTLDAFAHLVAQGVDSDLKATYEQGLQQLDQPVAEACVTEILSRLVIHWSGGALSTSQIYVAKDLVDRGADWRDILFVKPLEDDRCIAALLRLSLKQLPWATFFLTTFTPQQLLAFASTEEKAEAVYALLPADYLLDRIGEWVRVQALERDLGL